MDKLKIKRYAAILEIIIYLIVGTYFIGKTTKKYFINEIKENKHKHRENPLYLGVSDSPKSTLNSIIQEKVKSIFKEYLGFLTPVLQIFLKIFNQFKNSINRIRYLLRPIRDFIKSIVSVFYKKIQNFTIGMLYTLHKMRNSMKRTVSGFNLMIHSLEHSKNSIESLVKSPPVKMAIDLGETVEFVSDKAKKIFCFDANTVLEMSNGKKDTIDNVSVGDILSNNAVVIAKQKFLNNNYMYDYNGILVTGNHIVKEDGKWKFVKNSLDSKKTEYKPEYVYCLSTSDSEIIINNIIFKDYSELCDKKLNYTINSLILMFLNKDNKYAENIELAHEVKYSDNGFLGSTKIELNDGTYKKISDIEIGDVLVDENKVIGKVELYGKYFRFYNDRGIIVTSNIKTKFAGLWRNVEKTPSEKLRISPHRAYNIVTQNGKIPVFFAKEYRDYIELENPEINNAIDNIILNS